MSDLIIAKRSHGSQIQCILNDLLAGKYNLPESSVTMRTGKDFHTGKFKCSIAELGELLTVCTSINGCVSLLKDLLEAGISPEVLRQGRTPLYLAAVNGQESSAFYWGRGQTRIEHSALDLVIMQTRARMEPLHYLLQSIMATWRLCGF